jgi:hypothetical protein
MMAVLFLVGTQLEDPTVIAHMLDLTVALSRTVGCCSNLTHALSRSTAESHQQCRTQIGARPPLQRCPRKPQYAIAPDEPLILWERTAQHRIVPHSTAQYCHSAATVPPQYRPVPQYHRAVLPCSAT